MTADERQALLQWSAGAGLTPLAVTAYTSFVSSDAEERQANVADLIHYIDLAADISAQYVRAFLGELLPGADWDSAYTSITDSLLKTVDYAQSKGVTIAVEPHDDFVRGASIAPILERIQHPALGVIWDIGNTFASGEDPDESFRWLRERIAYVQIKDGRGRGPSWQLVSIGEGDVPIEEAFDLLLSDGYPGAFSVEWERAWHPELEPAEVALPASIGHVRKLLNAIQQRI
jgi:sugar phosphate isomerase/epimerase